MIPQFADCCYCIIQQSQLLLFLSIQWCNYWAYILSGLCVSSWCYPEPNYQEYENTLPWVLDKDRKKKTCCRRLRMLVKMWSIDCYKHSWSLLGCFSFSIHNLSILLHSHRVAVYASVFLWEIRWHCFASKADCCVQCYCNTMPAWNERGGNPEGRVHTNIVQLLRKIHGSSTCF